VAEVGYPSRAILKALDGSCWPTRIAEPKMRGRGVSRWRGDHAARRAVYHHRARLRSAVGRQALQQRAEKVERSFAHILDGGGLQRTFLRGREHVHQRYLIQVAAFNLGLVMRLLLGAGTPRWLMARGGIIFWLIDPGVGRILVVLLLPEPPAAHPRPDPAPGSPPADPRRLSSQSPLLQQAVNLFWTLSRTVRSAGPARPERRRSPTMGSILARNR
jgi:hypothetical protein